MHDEIFRDPSKETSLRIQNAKETLLERSKASPSPWNEGDCLDGFLLEKKLGSGSSGVVFRVFDTKTERRCALKLLKSCSPDELLRNKLGFRRMMPLAHPNLLRVDRIYQLGSYIALSMEEVKGVTFSEAIKEYRQLDPVKAYRQLLSLLRDFATGLDVMHSHELLHRDIKPNNLMVDESGRGRIIDYGLVESFGLNRNIGVGSNFLVGTPHFFPPEVICTQLYLPAGDIFSLGISMLEAIYDLQSESEKQHSVLERSRKNQRADAEQIEAAIRTLPDSVPGVILDACREMLEQEPCDRPTAMGLSRLGMPATQSVSWHKQEPLIGRRNECGKLFNWVEDVFNGELGRFHITGSAGIGKTRLLDEVVDYIEEKKWGQVFRARCRLREDHPLQAFDQICDAVANRYMRDDREVMTLDPVSVELLKGVFPVLGNVLKSNMQLPLNETSSVDMDKFIAATRLTKQLRQVGPLFLVIDDSQWADRDTLNLLDQLQSALGDAGLGIITASLEESDPQRALATHVINLNPLNLEESLAMIKRAADRWNVDINDGMLNEMALSAQGSPFRLQQLTDELRPGGAVANLTGDGVSNLPSLDRIWKRRLERLSDEARGILTYVVTSGGYVSTQQLGELTCQGETVDVAISELSQQGLVIDEATGGECITIFHDRVAGELIANLPQQDVQLAHQAWAALLVGQKDSDLVAARIAGHLFAANKPTLAVPHAITAAQDAERRLAMTEAGRWYGQTIAHVDDAEKVIFLRKAARCYAAATLPVEASLYYQELSTLVDGDESVECRLMATSLLLRCGRLETIDDRLYELAVMLNAPVPRNSRKRLFWGLGGFGRSIVIEVKLLFDALRSVVPRRSQVKPLRHIDFVDPNLSAHKSIKLDRQRLRMCMMLIRPMTFFDHIYAYDLCIAYSRLAKKCGNKIEEVEALIAESVFHCSEVGKMRDEAESNLALIRPEVEQLQSHQVSAAWWSGVAYSHALSCRWSHVVHPARTSFDEFQHVVGISGFEGAHMLWLDVWSNWFLGNWKEMFEITAGRSDDALRRSDFFQLALMIGGFGRGAWLGRDRVDDVFQLQKRCEAFASDSPTLNPFTVFDYVARIQECIYKKKFSDGWRIYQQLDGSLREFTGANLQLARVSALTVGTLLAIHQYTQEQHEDWLKRIRSMTAELRRERIPFTLMLADYYDGLMLLHVSHRTGGEHGMSECRAVLHSARTQAEQQHLLPYVLAAEDALTESETGQSSDLLSSRMFQHGVINPESFSRLYTVKLR
ncbi:MAG: serine/threonine-protein kinase PknK [Rubripirellula sp.]